MPELPDVECLRRYVDATSLHQPIDDVAVDAPRMVKDTSADNLRATLQGKAFRRTTRPRCTSRSTTWQSMRRAW